MHKAVAQFDLEVINEPTYSFGSADNVCAYPHIINLCIDAEPVSIHGVLYENQPLVVFGAEGGASGVHRQSLVCIEGRCYLAVGDHVVCFHPDPFSFEWALKTDIATCFGVHYQEDRKALISHGELEISRFSQDGKIVWSSSGADVFSERIALKPSCIEATDFNGQQYRFSYDSGAESF